MYVKDGILYKSMYCGLCKSLGGCCGQRSRFALSYDMTFLSALLHNIKNVDVKIEQKHCVLHPIIRRPIAADDELTRTVACLNAALTYYKLTDDVEDENKGKAARAFFRKAFRRAEALHPQACEIVKGHMASLQKLEKENCASLDMAADPFGEMIADLMDYCLAEAATEHTRSLAYGIGKWVYLIDALDDYEKDIKKGNYNPFYAAFGEQKRAQMLQKNGEEVNFVFRSVFAENAEHLRQIRFYFNHDLTDNIILRGMPAATQRIMCGCKDKVKPNRLRFN